jgi:multiple sugar transport system substrate-binding protein
MSRPYLRILVVGGPMYDALYQTIPQFEQHEGVTVDITRSANHPDLNQRIEQAFTEGSGYDLISTHGKFAPAQRDWLLPLDPYFSADELAVFQEVPLEVARIEGVLYGLPRNFDSKLLHFRSDLVERAPTTWDDLIEVARQLDGQQQRGFVFPGYGSGLFGHFFELCASAGQYLYQTDPPRPVALHEAGIWALHTLQTLMKVSPAQVVDWGFDEVAQFFAAGGAAFSTDWPGSFAGYQRSGIAGRLGLALYPLGPAGRRVYSGSHTFAVSRTASDRPAALALLRFLTSLQSQILEGEQGTVPARKDALTTVVEQAEVGSLEAQRWTLLAQTPQYAVIPPKHRHYPAVEAIIAHQVRQFLLGQVGAEQALQNMEEEGGRAAKGGSN